jgi:putative ABC transport system permease protein
VKALDLKLLRDLWAMKGQAVAIALVISSGIATYIMSLSTLDALQATQATFYRDYHFANVFASLKRAPESLRERIAEIPGVQQVETRVVAGARLEIEGFSDPVTAQIISVPDDGQPLLNQLYIRRGRTVEAGRDNEVVLSEAFAEPHRFAPGDSIYATINGRRRRLEVVGIALAPDFIYQLQPGSIIPDFKSFGILWMARTPLEAAFDMEGAFNDVSATLSNGASAEDVIGRLDEIIARYGGLGAYSRKDQLSNRYLTEEFRQLEYMATFFPAVFLSVAAFLLNVVVSRLIDTQREQVAILKAFGYSNLTIILHFLKLIVVIVILGTAGGIAFGMWLGSGMSQMYMKFYRFPYMLYHMRLELALTSGLISAAAAIAGTVYSVVRAAMLPPAEAMQPPPPAKYRVSVIERLGLGRVLGQPTRMIVRNIERRPVKAGLSVTGIAFSVAMLVMGGFFGDSVDFMVNVQFKLAQRDDMTLTFVEPASMKAIHSLEALPGVEYVEPFRAVPVRLRNGYRTWRTSIQGIAPDAELRRLFDTSLALVEIPANGVVLNSYLAGLLAVSPGELLTVEVLEGDRPVRQVPVVGLINEFVGVSAYMQLPALNRLMREGASVSGVYLQIDDGFEQQVYDEVKEMPRVAGTAVREKMLRNFYDTMANQILTFAFFNTLLAGTIAFGVVYNSTRIAFAERGRELASLRVLGFTRGEIAYILLGELSLLTLAAIPLGFLVGRGFVLMMINNMETELFRFPLILDNGTYAFSATVVLVSTLISGYMIKRKLDRLDLVAVLKTKE